MSKRRKKEKEVMIRRNDDDKRVVVECGEDWRWRGEGKGSFSNLESSDPLQVDSNPKHFGGRGRPATPLSPVPRLYCTVALRMLVTSAVMILILREL